ncbi:MAG: hypothetical protein A2Z02_01325, partial [Chloroflexi bacterium RBG_16_48_7]
MKINVSQLLKQALGTTRNISVDEQIANKNGEVFRVGGDISITRAGKGLFVSGELSIDNKGICGRCLEPFEYVRKLKVEEEFLPTVDINTGLPAETRDDAFQIDEHHQIDLGDVIYQYACMSIPMKLVCKEDCAGICPTCGKNLNKGKCGCS